MGGKKILSKNFQDANRGLLRSHTGPVCFGIENQADWLLDITEHTESGPVSEFLMKYFFILILMEISQTTFFMMLNIFCNFYLYGDFFVRNFSEFKNCQLPKPMNFFI